MNGAGLKITVINQVIIIVTCILAAVLFIIMQFAMWNYNEVSKHSLEYVRMEEQAVTVQEASDYLTSKVHDFMATGNVKHMEAYFEEANVTKRRERAINELSQQEDISYDDVRVAVEESKELMKREIYAMRLMVVACGYDIEKMPREVREMELKKEDVILSPSEKMDLARLMVHDAVYYQSKDKIYEYLDRFAGKVLDRIEEKMDAGKWATEISMFWARIMIILMAVVNVLIALVLNFLVKKPLDRFLVNIHEKTMLVESGTYEFRHLARVYNKVYMEKEESDRQKKLFRYKAEHDLMTGLQNRIAAEERVREYLEQEENAGVLILLDMDDLKGVNDTYGHDQGDKAIIGIADTLKTHFRNTDIVARLGGDEFMVYLPGAAKDCQRIQEGLSTLLQKLSEISVGGEDDRQVHCSVGCVVQSDRNDRYEILFKEADTALYHAKRAGKNRFVFYTPEMEKEGMENLEFATKYLAED